MTSPLFDLTGKVALITGGNGGIGLGMAKAIAQAGGDVCIWGTNPEKNAAALAELESTGAKVAALQCNVGNEQEVEDCFAQTLEQFGRVDGCFANAGVGGAVRSGFIDISLDEWRRVLGINLDGAFLTLRAAARHMVERAKDGDMGGRLVVTSSTASIMGAARNEHYGASKSAVIGMIKALAVEFARYQVTANSILPGWIETGMTQASVENQKFTDNVISRVPMRRWGKNDEFGGIGVYLMSDASSFHTGDAILIDGGYTNF